MQKGRRATKELEFMGRGYKHESAPRVVQSHSVLGRIKKNPKVSSGLDTGGGEGFLGGSQGGEDGHMRGST